jgi:hypothetical protein
MKVRLDAQLLDRLPRDIRLTDAGKIFEKEANKALEHSRRAISLVHALNRESDLKLRVGLSTLCNLPYATSYRNGTKVGRTSCSGMHHCKHAGALAGIAPWKARSGRYRPAHQKPRYRSSSSLVRTVDRSPSSQSSAGSKTDDSVIRAEERTAHNHLPADRSRISQCGSNAPESRHRCSFPCPSCQPDRAAGSRTSSSQYWPDAKLCKAFPPIRCPIQATR